MQIYIGIGDDPRRPAGPCLPCPELGVPPAVCAADQYTDRALLATCNGGKYVPPCRLCVASDPASGIVFGAFGPYANLSSCLGICSTGKLTRLVGGGYTAAAVPLARIASCQSCTENPAVPCGDRCLPGICSFPKSYSKRPLWLTPWLLYSGLMRLLCPA